MLGISLRSIVRNAVLVLILSTLPVAFACNNGSGPINPFNPKVPVISSITLHRGGTEVTDANIYAGELITVTVAAESQSVLGDCYTPGEITTYDPDLTTPTELDYSFEILTPPTSSRVGELTWDTPPANVARWRVPKVDDVPGHETGLGYTIRVRCLDDCVDLVTLGDIAVRVYSDKGPPLIKTLDVATRPGGNGVYTLEEKDLNDYYEVEPSDEIRIRSDATTQSDPSLCLGLSITPARSLHYLWETNNPDINISGNEDPAENKTIYLDVPDSFVAGETFEVDLDILDTCSGALTVRKFKFLVVEPPIITTWTVVDDGYKVDFDLYTGYYEVLAGGHDEIVANVENADPTICSWKGYNLTRSYSWQQTLSATLQPDLVYETIPAENFRSRLTFTVPAAPNGTKYNFRLTATDRCNGLSTVEDFPFLVIVPPTFGETTILEGSTPAVKNNITGRYEIHVGSTITITQIATSNCTDSFCTGRGIDPDESLEFLWKDDLEVFDIFYEPIPQPNNSSTIYVVIPPGTLGAIDTIKVTVEDRCNGIAISKSFIFEVVN
jgi:hypothetical protein